MNSRTFSCPHAQELKIKEIDRQIEEQRSSERALAEQEEDQEKDTAGGNEEMVRKAGLQLQSLTPLHLTEKSHEKENVVKNVLVLCVLV